MCWSITRSCATEPLTTTSWLSCCRSQSLPLIIPLTAVRKFINWTGCTGDVLSRLVEAVCRPRCSILNTCGHGFNLNNDLDGWMNTSGNTVYSLHKLGIPETTIVALTSSRHKLYFLIFVSFSGNSFVSPSQFSTSLAQTWLPPRSSLACLPTILREVLHRCHRTEIRVNLSFLFSRSSLTFP